MKKIYIEISDICGLKCSFCPTPKGIRGVMNLELFKKAVAESSRHTKLIALHILGDPLSVENLGDYLAVAKSANLKVEITTSGANLPNFANFDLLLNAPIKQVNFSLDALMELKNKELLLARIVEFCKYKKAIKSQVFVNLRVQKRARNRDLVAFLEGEFGVKNLAQYLGDSQKCDSRVKLGERVIIDFRGVFKWGNLKDLSLRGARSEASATKQSTINRLTSRSEVSKTLESNTQSETRIENRNNKLDSPLQNCDSNNLDSRDLDSSLVTLAQNDESSVDCFGESAIRSRNDRAGDDSQNLNCHESHNDKSIAKFKNANSKIFDEIVPQRKSANETHLSVRRSEADLRRGGISQKAEFVKGTCLALKTHIGILSNGEIVPCCMDFAGILSLGNIKDTTLDSALKSKKAQEMRDGFKANIITQPFCKVCDYRKRFDSKPKFAEITL